MADLELLRIGSETSGFVQGVLVAGGVAFAVTLERPWKENEANSSCIPAGTYSCKRIQSPKFGETFEVTEVPNRTNILFHKGNQVSDSRGCILVAEKFTGEMIGESAKGFEEFLAKFKNVERFVLSVIPVREYLPTR